MGHLRAGSWLALALVACGDAPPSAFGGYVEMEPVRMAAPIAGRLVKLEVQRGAEVAAGAPLFTLEQESEAAAVREARARVERADAAARDLEKGQRPLELAALSAAVDAQQAALARSDSELRRQRALATQGFVSGASLTALQAQRRRGRRGAGAGAAGAARGWRACRAGARRSAARRRRPRPRGGALAQAEWRLAQTAVAATAGALVTDTLYRDGEWVAVGTPVVRA